MADAPMSPPTLGRQHSVLTDADATNPDMLVGRMRALMVSRVAQQL